MVWGFLSTPLHAETCSLEPYWHIWELQKAYANETKPLQTFIISAFVSEPFFVDSQNSKPPTRNHFFSQTWILKTLLCCRITTQLSKVVGDFYFWETTAFMVLNNRAIKSLYLLEQILQGVHFFFFFFFDSSCSIQIKKSIDLPHYYLYKNATL